MDFNTGLSFLAAGVTIAVIAVSIYRGPRSFVQGVFATGMTLLALEAALTGFAYRTAALSDFLFWQRQLYILSSVVPAIWLMFAISFSRTNYSEQISRWKWVLLLAAAAPLSLVIFFSQDFISLVLAPHGSNTLFIRIGWAGYLWHLLSVIISIAVVMNLERTFRHSTGHIRWQTKFMFLGIGGIFAIRLFTDSQVVLFNGVDTGLYVADLGALLIADILILRSLFRGKPLDSGIQLSHQFLYTSFTILIVGAYFISLGVIAWILLHFEWIKNINLIVFLIFITVIILAAFLLSDRLRIKRKRFISRHFKRPQYDYQKIWGDFTQRTASVTRTDELCSIIVKMVSDTLQILSVSIWLVDEKQEQLSFGGSTVFTAAQAEEMTFFKQGGSMLIRAINNQNMPVDLKGREDDWVSDLARAYPLETKESQIRYCVPLNATGQLIGIMTLSEKVYYEALTFEESELIKTISDQAAASLLGLRLSERLRQTKELEAFQTMSAFFMHDLKNLASKLSLVTQNLPKYMDNPDFQADALKTMKQSVDKINKMSSRLSLLSQKIDLSCRETNINDMITAAIQDLKEYVKVPVHQDYHPNLPLLMIDHEQMNKVFENLFMNAYDAAGSEGRISVSTALQDNWVEISISDSGCGMSREFMEKNLFRPFQTTKKQGMGIGLYHCKTIIDAHGGKLNAESEEGKGTTFKILLPLGRKS
ncbi:MAG: Sensor protein ZraS [Deltaproteobacteria bacterium ADurb.Bin151]|nr:MAG: Sensor protein ZraS [Deltaproteobacteria bacterium ADurb.Bin151]